MFVCSQVVASLLFACYILCVNFASPVCFLRVEEGTKFLYWSVSGNHLSSALCLHLPREAAEAPGLTLPCQHLPKEAAEASGLYTQIHPLKEAGVRPQP